MAGRLGTFSVCGPTRYVMNVAKYGIVFDLDRVRRERHEFWGELIVQCAIGKHVDGVLSAADFNISGQASRLARAKFLAERAAAQEIDWVGLTEEFCQRVIVFDRQGAEAPRLRDIPASDKDDGWTVDGVTLMARHPVILFGDGGHGKSLVALYLVGQLAKRGLRVIYCDWEFDGESHRDRYGALFGEAMPESIWYARCDRSMLAEADRLRRLVQQHDAQYLVCDSIVFACAPGVPAESAEAASTYFQALRQIGVGSLNLAHTTKQNGDKDSTRHTQKPFGSGFWHNGARTTWFLKGIQDAPGELTVGLYSRKVNTGPLAPPVGWRIGFHGDAIAFSRTNVADHEELSQGLSVWERVRKALNSGAQTYAELAANLELPAGTIRTVANRHASRLVKVLGADGIARIGLPARP